MLEHDDAELELFLHKINKYESEKKAAAKQWRDAFLTLSRARLQIDLNSQQQDPTEAASTTVRSGELIATATGPSPSFGGAWPPAAVKEARCQFLAALDHELRASAAGKEATL